MLLKGPRFSARPSPTWHFWLGNALSERPLNCARESIKTVKDLRRITLNDQPHILLPRFEQGPKKNLYLSPTSYGPTVCADYIGRINICIACLAVWWWLIAHMCGSFPYHVCVCVSQGPCVSDKRTWCVLFMPNDHTTRTKNKRMGFFSVCRAYYMLFLGFVDHFTFCVRIFFRQPPPPQVVAFGNMGIRVRQWDGCRYLYEGTYRLCSDAPMGLVHLDWRGLASGRKVESIV